MKIIKTNWINLLGVFTAVFVYAIFLNLTDINVSRNLFQSILPALMLVCLYGILFWVLLILLLVLFDLIFFVRDQTNLTVKLLVEWLIISSPFIYWAVKYREWIFIAGIVAFLITQFIRQKRIRNFAKG
jgi:hypothetical protein